MRLAVVCCVILAASPTQAENWWSAELPAAAAVAGPQEQTFRAGAMPALGAYIGTPQLALGVRLRAGILRDGAPPAGHLADPGTGGLATGGLAARLGVAGGWAELVVGGGVTGSDVAPVVEGGVGWAFAAGAIDVGPSVRYLRVVAGGDMPGSANLLLFGVDVELGRHHAVRVEHVEHVEPAVVAAAPAPVVAPPPVPVDRDDDHALDLDLSCSDLLAAGDPDAGCPANDAIKVEGDRIILDERVLFDTDRAHVKTAGREVIAQIANAWKMHPDWKAITIEGHADQRGPDDYNLQLSQLRAERVRDVLLRHGFAPESVHAIGYGRTRPRDLGNDEQAHQHNRRVEFVIERSAP